MKRLFSALSIALLLAACNAVPTVPEDSVTPAPPADSSKTAFMGEYVLELNVYGTNAPDRTLTVSFDEFKPYSRVGKGTWDEGVVFVMLEPQGSYPGAPWVLDADLYRGDLPIDLGPDRPLPPSQSEQVLSVTAKAPEGTQDFSGLATYSNCNEASCNQTRTAVLRKAR